MTGSVQGMIYTPPTGPYVPVTVFFDDYVPDGATNSHLPDISTLPSGIYNVDGTDFNTLVADGTLVYSYASGTADYGVASYGEVGEVFAEQRNFVLTATINFGAYSGLSYKSLYLLVRRNSGVYGISIADSTLTLYGCDDGSFSTGIVIIDDQDTALEIVYTDSSVDITLGSLSFSRPRQAPQSPVSNDWIKGLYILLAAGPCSVTDVGIVA